jgi:hypothetical protein
MKLQWKQQWAVVSLTCERQWLAKQRAGLLLAATVATAGVFAACSSNDSNNPGGGTVDAGGMDSGNPGAESGTDGSADPGSAQAVRAFINDQIPGGIAKLTVPPTDGALPVPPAPQGYAGRYDTTEAKRYLGKLLFHDPIRTQRVNVNQGQPLDFPAKTAFGGTLGVTDTPAGPPPSGTFADATSAVVQQVRDDTVATGSCGSCHIGEAAGKAGQLLNFNTGGEGRGYTDANGSFVPRRRPMATLVKLRSQPIFPGDALADALPTLTDIFQVNGSPVVATPALFYHNIGAPSFGILQSGRLDQLDSVARQSPALIGFAFNNRLLFGGFAGEPHATPGSLQPSSILLNPPFDDPAQENLTFLLLDAHRMLGLQAAALQAIPAFVQAFREAFPQEAAAADVADGGFDANLLINDFTEARAQATFLRTVVTRNTPSPRRSCAARGSSSPRPATAARAASAATAGRC